MEQLWSDVKYAARLLARSPGFTAVAIVSLALGVGANTTIFSLLNALMLRPLPVPEPNQLVQFTYTMPGPGPNNWNSWIRHTCRKSPPSRTVRYGPPPACLAAW